MSLSLAAVCATCDASAAFRSPGVHDITLTWSADTVLAAGSTTPAALRVVVDGEEYPGARLRLTTSDSTIVGIGTDGVTLHARRLGTATVTARLLDPMLPANGPALSTALVVSPHTLRLANLPDTLRSIGDTVRLAAEATDVQSAPIPGAAVTWSSTDTTVATISAAGLVTARRNGSAVVTAAAGGLATGATLVVQQRPTAVRLSPEALQLGTLGADSVIAATVVDARGEPLQGSATSIAWSTSNGSVAAVAAGTVTAVANGEAWIRASAGDVRDSVPVQVAQRAARIVVETPSPVAMRSLGETAVLRARAYDAGGHEVLTTVPAWRSVSPFVVHVESRSGVATGLALGSALLVAELDDAADSLTVTVADVASRVVLEPATATLTSVGDTLALSWAVRNALGVTIADAPVTFGSSDSAIVRALASGHVVAVGTGTARVVAAAEGGVADTAMLTVVNAVAHVDLVPAVATLASIGDSVVPDAVIRNARSADLPRTAASWSSDDPGIARVTTGGIVIATGAGETMIRASSPTYPDRRDSLAVAVTNAPASVTIERDADTLTAVGTSRTYAVEVRNRRGALVTVAPQWQSLDLAVARVSTTGLVTAAGAGTARIVATAGAAADTLVLTVRDDPATIELSPAAATLTSLGDVLRPTATARNALGTVIADPPLTWSVGNPAIAAVTADGSVTALGIGTTSVVVRSGTLADTLHLTVTNLPVLVDITAAADTITAIGDSIVLAVEVRNARGDTLSGTALTWTVDDPVVARVSASGVVTARGTGATVVRASGGGARDSLLLVVTNAPALVTVTLTATGEAATTDTMTATGQSLAYTAAVGNAIGLPIADATVSWRSTQPAVAQVTASGTVTAVGFGSALIVAASGVAADSVLLVVREPGRLYVDNAVITAERFGTLTRPYATIQAAIDAAGVDDTVIIRRGTSYSEAVTLGRRVILLGDSTDFVAAGRDPLQLPLLRHDLGEAGITAATPGASYTIRYLGVQHSVDGEAIAIRGADNVTIEAVHVNPAPGFRTGRGLLVEDAAGTVSIARSTIDSVYAFGIRLVNATGAATLDGITVRGVAARAEFTGAGIDVRGGTAVVRGATVRRTTGPQVRFMGTTDAVLATSVLTGEQQLVRVDSARGATLITGNTFDLRRQAGDAAPPRGGGAPDPSGIEVVASAGVQVDGNVFTDVGGQASLMDAIRLQDVRVGASSAPYGARLTGNRIGGSRTAVRAEGASFTLAGSRIDSAAVAVLLTAADTASLTADTVAAARTAAIQSSGSGADLRVSQTVISGPQRALVVTAAGLVSLRNSTIIGAANGALPDPTAGTIDVAAASAVLVGNVVNGVRGWAGIMLRGGFARADSNLVTRNLIGIRIGAAAWAAVAANAIFDNDTLPDDAVRGARGLVADGRAAAVGDNWWGAPEGPQSSLAPVPGARGDSVIGVTAGILAQPIAAHGSSAAPADTREIAGDGQSGPVGASLARPLTVRVVDATGRPVVGASVTFRVSRDFGNFTGGVRSGNQNQVVLATDANGLAEAEYLPSVAGTATVTASAGAAGAAVTFTVTGY